MDILEKGRNQRVGGQDGELIELLCDEIERLRDFFEYDANCPCCQQSRECEEGCSFAEDAPEAYKKMVHAREILTPNV